MQKKNNFFLKIIICLFFTQISYSGYSEQYLIALQDLVKVHKKYFPQESIVMNNSSLVYSVYKKIITPWALNINGMAHIVQNKFSAQQPYLNDIQRVFKQFQASEAKVENLKQYFLAVDVSGLLDAFYKEIGQDVVQIFFDMIQQCANELTIKKEDLQACYIAYQIAFTMYQSDMNISGVQEGADFESVLSGNMVVLYQNAIKNLLNQLSIGMLESNKIEDIYEQIARYYSYLAVIGTNIKDTQLISTSQAQAQQSCQNYGYYLQAQKLYQDAEALLKKYSNSASLDVNAITTIAAQLTAIGKNIGQVIQLAQESNQLYSQAQDIFGANQAELLYSLVNNIDLWIVQGVAQLWLLYLQDQSLQNQYTAPTITNFIAPENQNSSNPVTNDQVISAFQNLSALIQKDSNSINALSTINVLKEYSLLKIINSLKEQIITIIQSGTMTDTSSSWMYNFASLEAMTAVENILFYVTHLSNSIIKTLSGSGSNHALLAMAYAQALDEVYQKLTEQILIQVNTLVPYFPKQAQQVKTASKSVISSTWVEWTQQILLTSLTVNLKDLAMSKVAKVQIQTPTLLQKKPKQKDITNLEELAHQDALNGNFSKASAKYQDLMNMYTTLYSINPSDASVYENMMQAKTMYTALSFAGTIEPSGSQTWGAIKNIPVEYTANRYGFNDISLTSLGMSELPASLIGIATGTVLTTFNAQQRKDILQLIKAYVISRLLSVQGIEFNQAFTNYNLEFNSSIDDAGRALATQIEAQVEMAFNKFQGVAIISLTLTDATTIESVVCKNIALSDVNPLFSSMATALSFYSSAQLLVEPQTNEVKLGNASYVSGNDEKLSGLFLEKMIKVYLSAAYPYYQNAKELMSQATASLKSGNKNTGTNFPKSFSSSLQTIDSHVVRAQALLYAQDQSAYAYAIKAGKQELAQQIEAIFFNIYKEYVAWMKNCLTGKSPFDPTYQIVLHKINTVYITWSSLLQVQNQILQVQAINNDIINLFTTAGQGCMNISYTQPLYPNFTQYHYATAAHYFLAVQAQYNKMNEPSKAQSINQLINDAYFKGSSQNIALFLDVQKNGVVITHQETKEQQTIAFSDLIAKQVFSSMAEQNAYDSVQNLLLNAGMGYSFLTKRVQASLGQTLTTKQAITKESQSGLSANVTTFLRDNNIMSSSDVEPAYFQVGVAQSIFAVNMNAYNQFKNNQKDYASWLNVVYSALQALYAFNYLGAKEGETATDMQNQMTGFFSELEKHTSSLENPSSVYVG